MVKDCKKECWMTGNAVPVMKKHILMPLIWVLKNKLLVMINRKPVLKFDFKK
jgi:hypothetical protein